MPHPWPRAVWWAGRAEVRKLLPSQVLQQAEGVTNCKTEREAMVTHCPRAGSCDVLVPQQQTLPVPVPTSHRRGHVLHHSPLLLQVHPVWPQLPEAGRAGGNAGDTVGWAPRTAASSPTAQLKQLAHCSEFRSYAQRESRHECTLASAIAQICTVRASEVTVISIADITTPWLVTSPSIAACIRTPAWAYIALHHSVIFVMVIYLGK